LSELLSYEFVVWFYLFVVFACATVSSVNSDILRIFYDILVHFCRPSSVFLMCECVIMRTINDDDDDDDE